MRKALVLLTTVLGAAALGGVVYWHQSSAEPTREAAPASQPEATPVVAGVVQNGPVPIYLRGVGTVIAYNNVVVRSQITGPLIKVSFKQGETVRKGDLLAEIDPRPYQAQLDQAVANRDRDQAQIVNAQTNLNRYVPLQEKGFATGQLVDTQKAQVAQLEAMVKGDEAAIESARVNLSYTKLTAPLDGVTGIRQIDEGNIIHPTDANGLVDVTQIQPISLIFTLPETTFIEIQKELAKGPIKVFAYSQDDKTKLDEGELLLIDNQINQTTGTIRLRATFPNGERLLWPGELVNARLLLKTEPHGLTIAAGAVQQGPKGPYVYVINPDQSVQPRPVKVAQIDEGKALIASGLKENEQVVVDGQYKLQAGTHIQVLTGKAAEEANMQSAVEQAIP
ncbi:efflux RND transporter periplasmic adaptor subunit [Bradyrhizobium sp.]|jgi:multidrug efflux system membrane fusion protein|uniref:efflux RND transporter periplasmic adaptor subunit n=1 Tax=Bradyrhizobium sp. TaxID=376 RepID=UPI003C1E055A